MSDTLRTIRVACSSMAKLTGHNTFNNLEKDVKDLLYYNKFHSKNENNNKIEVALAGFDTIKFQILKKTLGQMGKTKKEFHDFLVSEYLEELLSEDLTNDEAIESLDEKLIDTILGDELGEELRQELLIKRTGVEESIVPKIGDVTIKNGIHTTIIYIDPYGDFMIELRGKMEGKVKDGVVIDNKNRKNKLYDNIPLYEKVQMECYMILSGCDEAIWRQHYNGESDEKVYEHDEEFWNECMEYADRFIRNNIIEQGL
jgi:hypothetical protein